VGGVDVTEPYLRRLQNRMARGDSLEEAGAHYGLELWRAKAIFVRSGLPVPTPVRHRRTRTPAERALGAKVHAYLAKEDSATATQVAEALGVTRLQVRAAVWPQDAHRLRRVPGPTERYPTAGILIALQAMSLDRGQAMGARGRVPVPASYWDSHRDPLVHPGSPAVAARFGGWRAACVTAGVPVKAYGRGTAVRTWTDEECLDAVRAFFAGGHGWGSSHYAAWARTQDVPSVTTVLHHLGPWPAVRATVLG
jgi:hypothetical protein